MVSVTTLLIIVWLHLFADFFLQTDKMAISKSSSNAWLGVHVTAYTIPFLIFFGWKYALVNGAAHFVTDYFTSRTTSYLWKKEERHWFFVVIGIDQALHMTALILTIPLMGW